jgi:hypothetical protein
VQAISLLQLCMVQVKVESMLFHPTANNVSECCTLTALYVYTENCIIHVLMHVPRCLLQLEVPLPKSGTLNVVFCCLVSCHDNWLQASTSYCHNLLVDCTTVGTDECIQSIGWHGNGSMLATLSKVWT